MSHDFRDKQYLPEIYWPERDPRVDRLRVALALAGCVASRQWGGNPVMAVVLPAPSRTIVTVPYRDHASRMVARRVAYERAHRELFPDGTVT